MAHVIAPGGQPIPFDRARLEASLRRRGLEPVVAAGLASRVEHVLARERDDIAIEDVNPIVGEALLDLLASPAAPAAGAADPGTLIREAMRRAARAAHATAEDPRLDPSFAQRAALVVPLGQAGPAVGGDAAFGMAFPAPGVTRTVYANDTKTERPVTLSVAWSGHVKLGFPDGRHVELDGLGREVRDLEVPPGGRILVQGLAEPYSVVGWWIR